MTDYLPILVMGFVVALGLTPLSRRIALWLGLVDQPRERRLHAKPTPLMGGLAIYGALVLTLALFGLQAHFVELGAILAGATLMALLGLWDDRRELKPGVKLAGQIVAGVALIMAGVQVSMFGSPALDWALTLFWIVGVTNALNFLDNMDGLAAGASAIASGFFFLLAATEGQRLVGSLAAALCGASVGFLVYNFSPASSFMGDMGSLVLGFTLAVLGIKLRFAGQPPNITWMIPILVLALPIFDTTLVTFTRLRERRPASQGGKDHTSHRLINLGLSQRAVLVILYAVCAVSGIAAVVVSRAPHEAGPVVGGAALVLSGVAFGLLEWSYIRHKSQS
jgi:UDP-GlcNAc:undecaprenyl-phosphate GlcNAc-1-phosphate transferase